MERFVLLMNPVCRRFTWRFRPHHSQHLSCFPCLEPISLAVCGFYLFIFFFICSGLNQMKELLLSLRCSSHSRCPIFAVPRSCFRLYRDLPSLCVKLVWHRNEREGKKTNKKKPTRVDLIRGRLTYLQAEIYLSCHTNRQDVPAADERLFFVCSSAAASPSGVSHHSWLRTGSRESQLQVDPRETQQEVSPGDTRN